MDKYGIRFGNIKQNLLLARLESANGRVAREGLILLRCDWLELAIWNWETGTNFSA